MYIPGQNYEAPPAFLSMYSQEASNKDSGQSWSSLIGVITAICGNVLISFALNTQRYAHLRLSRDREAQQSRQREVKTGQNTGWAIEQRNVAEDRSSQNANGRAIPDGDGVVNENTPLIPELQRGGDDNAMSVSDTAENSSDGELEEPNYLKSKLWWAGIALMVAGEAGNFLAYGFAPASVVSPLGVVALVANCLIAPLLLGERFRMRDGLGVVIAVAGCVIVVMSASDSNPRLGPEEIWGYISTWEFETYLGVTVFLMVLLSFLSQKYGDRTVLIDLGLVGLFGGYTALSTKGVASLLSNTIWHVVTFPITYLLVAVLGITAVMQIKHLNRALQRFNSTIVIPTQFVMFTISVIVGSAILYRDFERTTTNDALMFFGGCAGTFLGVWCITSGRDDGSQDGDDGMKLEDEIDAVDLIDNENVQPEIRERGNSYKQRQPARNGPSFKSNIHADTRSDELTTSLRNSDRKRPDGSTSVISPANTAAIHLGSTADLISRDQPQSQESQPPPLHATTSAPTVAILRPKTPGRGFTEQAPSSPSQLPQTPERTLQRQLATTPPERQKLQARRSVIGRLPAPAPYTSPLSSSLSAIVAESRRRDHTPDVPPLSPLRRKSNLNLQDAGRDAEAPASSRKPSQRIAGSEEADTTADRPDA